MKAQGFIVIIKKKLEPKKNHHNLCIDDNGLKPKEFFGLLGVCHQGSGSASTCYWCGSALCRRPGLCPTCHRGRRQLSGPDRWNRPSEYFTTWAISFAAWYLGLGQYLPEILIPAEFLENCVVSVGQEQE